MENLTNSLIENEANENFPSPKFSWHDYTLFMIMLALSLLIGVYFGFFQKKKSSGAEEYLLGGKQMGVFEISLSLISSSVSGLTILGVPGDVYKYGVTIWLSGLAIFPVMLISYYLVMPIFYKLKTPSTYEYLSARFDLQIRQIASILFTLLYLLYIPVVLYIPALALAQGTGFNIHYITPLICGVCIFYTCVGGLKAVVWTDALQFIVMIGAVLVVTFIGTNAQGGFMEVFNIASENGRLTIDFDPDVTLRDTFWSVLIGMMVSWSQGVTFSQGCIQKCLSLPSSKQVKKAYIAFGLGYLAFASFSVYSGLLIYARYRTCDPYLSHKTEGHDQILPFYILDVGANIPGLPGIFIAGIFSASLSTLSATLNCLSCTIYEDFIAIRLTKESEAKYVNAILKTIVVVAGIICTLLVLVVQHFKSVLEISLTVGSLCSGPLSGLFVLGMFFPSANKKGALWGLITSLVIMGYIIFTSLYFKLQGYMIYPTKSISVEECILPANVTIRSPSLVPEWNPPFIYRISFFYYGLMGTVLVNVVGYLVSRFTKSDKGCVDKDLISPAMHWAINDRKDIELPNYYSVEKANDILAKN